MPTPMLGYNLLNERMAAAGQQHRIRLKGAGESSGLSDGTKLSTELDGIRRGHSELVRYAQPRPRDGQLRALEVPLQRSTLADPEPLSRA
eukprot:4259718-Pleurochrysis_carterae.AAC.1